MFAVLDLARALVLGLLQGITEFLPISSDGHLAIGRALVGGTEASLAETVLLHVGTLVATLVVLRVDVANALRATRDAVRSRELESPASREVLAVIVASIPTAVIGLLLESRVEAYSENLVLVGVFLSVSGAFVGATHWFRDGTGDVLPLRAAFVVGVIQGLAVLPGWSRSGSTIATAMALGLAPAAAFRFSFLLSLPAVAGACILELRDPVVLRSFDASAYVGALIAFVSGALALAFLRSTMAKGRFAWFSPYLFVVAAILVAAPYVAR